MVFKTILSILSCKIQNCHQYHNNYIFQQHASVNIRVRVQSPLEDALHLHAVDGGRPRGRPPVRVRQAPPQQKRHLQGGGSANVQGADDLLDQFRMDRVGVFVINMCLCSWICTSLMYLNNNKNLLGYIKIKRLVTKTLC